MAIQHKYIFFVFFLLVNLSFAQTADDVISRYLEKSGGTENWSKLSATKMLAEVENEGMTIPIKIYSTKEGKQAIIVDFMGDEITQFAYDGQVLWSTNSNMKPQKADEESIKNMKYSKNDFPTPFLNYKKKGYEVTMMGKEVVDGKESYKILLVQEPIYLDGIEEESMSYYYFDAESYLPIMVETEIKGGPMEGQFSTSKMGSYRPVNGLYFPFSIFENGRELKIIKIELDPELEDSLFSFPERP